MERSQLYSLSLSLFPSVELEDRTDVRVKVVVVVVEKATYIVPVSVYDNTDSNVCVRL